MVALPRRMARLRTFVVLGLFGLSALACNRVRVDGVLGPDGQEWQRISCRHMDPRCYQTAQRMCPNGYFMTYEGHAGEPLVGSAARTDEGSVESDNTPAAPPRPGENVTKLPPQSQWSRDMYSRSKGAILVRCASGRDHSS